MERLDKTVKEAEKIVIMGIGNTLRSDDAAGIKIIEKLKEEIKGRKGITIINCGEAPENFLGKIEKIKPTHIIIVDAIEMYAEPGSIGIFQEDEIKDYPTISTHNISPTILLAYIREIIKAKTTLIGIQPQNIEFGEEITPKVKKAIKIVTEVLIEKLKEKTK